MKRSVPRCILDSAARHQFMEYRAQEPKQSRDPSGRAVQVINTEKEEERKVGRVRTGQQVDEN